MINIYHRIEDYKGLITFIRLLNLLMSGKDSLKLVESK